MVEAYQPMASITSNTTGKPVTLAWKHQPIITKITVKPAQPASVSGRRPSLSTVCSATKVNTRLVAPTMMMLSKIAETL